MSFYESLMPSASSSSPSFRYSDEAGLRCCNFLPCHPRGGSESRGEGFFLPPSSLKWLFCGKRCGGGGGDKMIVAKKGKELLDRGEMWCGI